VSCAKTAEPIEMQSGILIPESSGSEEYELHGNINAPGNGHFCGVCRWKSIVKHRILGLGKNRWTSLNDLHVVRRVFCARGCLLGVAIIAPCLKILV